jgi:hypothetical protein
MAMIEPAIVWAVRQLQHSRYPNILLDVSRPFTPCLCSKHPHLAGKVGERCHVHMYSSSSSPSPFQHTFSTPSGYLHCLWQSNNQANQFFNSESNFLLCRRDIFRETGFISTYSSTRLFNYFRLESRSRAKMVITSNGDLLSADFTPERP